MSVKKAAHFMKSFNERMRHKIGLFQYEQQ